MSHHPPCASEGLQFEVLTTEKGMRGAQWLDVWQCIKLCPVNRVRCLPRRLPPPDGLRLTRTCACLVAELQHQHDRVHHLELPGAAARPERHPHPGQVRD